jgi:hypothetical protein
MGINERNEESQLIILLMKNRSKAMEALKKIIRIITHDYRKM